MKNLRITLLAAILTLAATISLAGARQGDYEFGAQLGGAYYTGDVASMGETSVNFLIHYTDNIALGARMGFGAGGGDTSFTLKLEGQYLVSFNEKLDGYVGLVAGGAFMDVDNKRANDLEVGGIAGVKTMFTENIGMFGELHGGALMGQENSSYLGLGVGAFYKF